MTIERLQQYSIIAEQLELIKREYIPSYISGADTSRISVQSGKKTDITAKTAIEQIYIDPAIREEYTRLSQELRELNEFIFNINDELVRAIVIRRFIPGRDGKVMIWDDIARDLHYSEKHCRRIMNDYFNTHLERCP